MVGMALALAAFPFFEIKAQAQESAPVLEVPDANASSEKEMKPYKELIEQTEAKIDMVPIPGGKFRMGSPDSESGAMRRKARFAKSKYRRFGCPSLKSRGMLTTFGLPISISFEENNSTSPHRRATSWPMCSK